MIFASLGFSLMGFCVKQLSSTMDAIEIVFYRNLFGCLWLIYSFIRRPAENKGGKFFLLFSRGFLGFLGLSLFFYNITIMPLADAMAFNRTSPVFTSIFAFIFLKEVLSKKVWFAIFLCFVGVICMSSEFFSNYNFLITGIMSGVVGGFVYALIRGLSKYYGVRTIVFSFTFIGTVVPALLISFGDNLSLIGLHFLTGKFSPISSINWYYIFFLGLFATLSQLFMTKAYSLVKAGIVGVISYLNIPFSILLGFIYGDVFPSFLVFLGMSFIILSGVFISKEVSRKDDDKTIPPSLVVR